MHTKGTSGFTLVEIVLSMTLGLMIMSAVASAYLFLGKNLGRLANAQQIEQKSHLALQYFTNDVASASSVDSASTGSQLQLTVVPSSGGSAIVTYAYDNGAGTLTRTYESNTPVVLMTDLTQLNFGYFSKTGTVNATPLSTRQIQVSFTTAAGSPANGTQSSFTYASPRMAIRNKPVGELYQ
ncbi:MAG: hypothetical protein PHQ04_01920 [Opitutaceae bacterium]|nr:hypothetical protein [Opitutaceae bacterium]